MLLVGHYLENGQKKEAFAIWFKCFAKCPFKFYGNARYLYAILKGSGK